LMWCARANAMLILEQIQLSVFPIWQLYRAMGWCKSLLSFSGTIWDTKHGCHSSEIGRRGSFLWEVPG
jgi:hypothetical protein